MIFVTVGSRPYQFNRLFKKLDELYDCGILKEEMYAQIGASTYKPRNYSYIDYISPEEFDKRIEEASIVVSHGASGSIMKALNAGKKVIAVTRLEKYGEHINDHQIQNNITLSDKGYVISANLELDNLGECFMMITDNNKHLKRWENKDRQALLGMIDDFIKGNWN
ncbi:MAG: glycosyl transferase [Lachnospiraceae bacterium]|nr:glycosyl transferase [Lachnospiraceae bacterium]